MIRDIIAWLRYWFARRRRTRRCECNEWRAVIDVWGCNRLDVLCPVHGRRVLIARGDKMSTPLRSRANSQCAVEQIRDMLGSHIREMRLTAQLTQQDLSKRSGVHVVEICRIENAAIDPRLSTVMRLLDALDVPLEPVIKGIPFVAFQEFAQ